MPGSPWANDNASGVAVILELARILAGTREADGIRFVAFGAEEVQPGGGHHFGSAAYAESVRPRAMVSVDMIGLDRLLIVGWMGIGKRHTVAELLKASKATGVHARESSFPIGQTAIRSSAPVFPPPSCGRGKSRTTTALRMWWGTLRNRRCAAPGSS